MGIITIIQRDDESIRDFKGFFFSTAWIIRNHGILGFGINN